jgi:cephalosporin hydroxylase
VSLPPLVDPDVCVAAFGDWQYPMWKHADDLARYRHIIAETRPEIVVECGTRTGHSAAFFAERGCRVVTVDILDRLPQDAAHPEVIYIVGDSTKPMTVGLVTDLVGDRRAMVSLDSDHSADHVAAEIEAYAPLVSPGCHLVVEDGVIAWLDEVTKLEHGCQHYAGTVLGGIEHARAAGHLDGFERDVEVETLTPVTMFPAGWWRRR